MATECISWNSRSDFHCIFLVTTWLTEEPMIKAKDHDNFNKIKRTELTDVIVIHFFRQEFSKEHDSRFFALL